MQVAAAEAPTVCGIRSGERPRPTPAPQQTTRSCGSRRRSASHLKKRHVLSLQEALLVHVRVADERAVLSRVSISWRGDHSGQSYKPKGLRGALGDTRTLGSPKPGAGQRGWPLSPENTDARVTRHRHPVPGTPTSDAPRGRGPGCWDSCLCPSNPASVSPPTRHDSKTRRVRASDRRVTLSQVGGGWGGLLCPGQEAACRGCEPRPTWEQNRLTNAELRAPSLPTGGPGGDRW